MLYEQKLHTKTDSFIMTFAKPVKITSTVIKRSIFSFQEDKPAQCKHQVSLCHNAITYKATLNLSPVPSSIELSTDPHLTSA